MIRKNIFFKISRYIILYSADNKYAWPFINQKRNYTIQIRTKPSFPKNDIFHQFQRPHQNKTVPERRIKKTNAANRAVNCTR